MRSSYYWLRLHTEIRDDPKLRMFDDHEFRLWITLLCLACEAGEDGLVRMSPDDFAWVARSDCDRVRQFFEKGAASRVVTLNPEGILVINYAARQLDKPSDSREARRKRKSRSRAVTRGHWSSRDRGEIEESRVEESTVQRTTFARSSAKLPQSSAPKPPEWSANQEDTRKLLTDTSAPEEFQDPLYWKRIDDWLGGPTSGVFYFAEFRKFLAHQEAQPKSRRKKHLRRAFRNWLSKSEFWRDQRAQRQLFATRRT